MVKTVMVQSTEGEPAVQKTVVAPLMHSIPSVCETLSVGRSTIYELIGNGTIRTVKVGRRRLVPHDELIRFRDALIAAQVSA